MALGNKFPRMVEIEQIAWAASALKTRELPRSVYKGLILKMDFLATTTGTPALTREEMAKAITTLRVVVNGQDNIINIPFYALYFMNMYDASKEPDYSFDLVAAGTGKVIQMTCFLPFALTRSAVPEDTLLDLRRLNAVLEVQFGAAAISSTVTITSGNLRVWSIEYADVKPKDVFARHELSTLLGNLAATGTQQVKLDVLSNNQYKRLIIITKDNSGVRSNAQINKIGLRSRSFYYHSLEAAALQSHNALQYAQTPQTGVYILDLCSDGKMVQRLDASNLPELILELNSLVSNGTVEVIADKAIYARGKGAQAPD